MDHEKVKSQVLRRLKIAKGQLEGIERMVEQGAYCVDVLTQISAAHEALRGAGKLIVDNHLRTCVAEGIRSGDAEAHYQELMKIIYKLSK